jgi:parallel beta-helix repeat protein
MSKRCGAFLLTMASTFLCTGLPAPARAANTCNSFISFDYPTAGNFTLPGETLRVRLTLSAGQIQGGTLIDISRLRFDLDCNSGSPLALGCTDEGAIVEYMGDSTITESSTCVDKDIQPVSFSTGHATATSPNQVVFTPSKPIRLFAATGDACFIEFDVRVLTRSVDPTPAEIEQVAGFDVGQNDATCDNGLMSSGSQSGSILLCRDCNDNNACTTDACNQDTNTCTNEDGVTPTCDDNNPCTVDTCVPATGQCSNVDDRTSTCDDNNACTTDRCAPATGACENIDTVTPTCNDNNACTTDRCVPATGACENIDTVTPTCNDNNGCTTDRCVPATGTCENIDTVTPTCNDNNACTTDRCVPATGQCSNIDDKTAGCDDNDVCTIDSCNPMTGACVHVPDDTNPVCNVSECGDNASGPCLVAVDTPPGTFDSLQQAINAAADGATIHVTGVCVESVLIDKRNNLTIEGDAPTALGCPPDGLDPADLTSTVKGDSQDVTDVIKVRNSMNIVIRFLNIVDGGTSKTGLEFRTGMSNIAHCNCITRNKNGVEFDHHSKGTASKNLIFKNNRDGIWLHRCVLNASLIMNTSRENLDDGMEIDDSCTESNLVSMNLVTRNVHDGIEIVDSDKNTIVVNEVTFNGKSKSKDSGIELKPGTGTHGADDNFVDGNDIHDNSDMLLNLLNCKQTNGHGNTGNNVPPKCM